MTVFESKFIIRLHLVTKFTKWSFFAVDGFEVRKDMGHSILPM